MLDFIQFKPIVRGICDSLDHRMLLPLQNPNLEVKVLENRVEATYRDGSFFCFPKKDVVVLDLPNTSTEMLARYIAQRILEALPSRIPDAKVRALEVSVEESPGQSGVYRIRFDAATC